MTTNEITAELATPQGCIQRLYDTATNAGAGCGGVGGIMPGATQWLPIRFNSNVILTEAMSELDKILAADSLATGLVTFIATNTNLALNADQLAALTTALAATSQDRLKALVTDVVTNRKTQPALLTIAPKGNNGTLRFVAANDVTWNGHKFRGYVVKFNFGIVDVQDPDACIETHLPG